MSPINVLPAGFRLIKPDVVLYHAECADGFGAAWAFRQFFGGDIAYIPYTYGEKIMPGQYSGKRVVMVDVSVPRNDFIRLSQETDLFLIDHHVSASEVLADLPNTFFDMKRSGAGLAWDIASMGAPRPLLIDLLEDRDLKRYSLPQTNLLRVLDSLPQSFPVWTGFSRALVQDPDKLSVEAHAIERYEGAVARRVRAYSTELKYEGFTGVAINAPPFMSGVLAEQFFKNEGLPDFLMIWFYEPGLDSVSCIWEARPGEALGVLELAKKYGGGGNKYSAGARISWDDLGDILGIRI